MYNNYSNINKLKLWLMMRGRKYKMTKSKLVLYKTSYKYRLVLTTIIISLGLIFSNFAVATMNINQLNSNPVLLKNNLVKIDDSLINSDVHTLDEPFATTWDVQINFSEPSSSATDYIIFGEATDASDGQDSYDIPNPPPGMPPFLDAYFTTNLTSPYDKLLQEIKFYPDTYKVWNYSAWWTGSSATTVTMSWDPNDVNDSEYDSVMIYNSTNDPVADMLVDSNYSSTVASYNIISFQIICMVDLDAPEITDNSPASGTTGDSYIFNATVIDNLFDTDDLLVKVNWSHGSFSSNDTMSNTGDNYFEQTITLDENSVSDLTYHFYARDNAIASTQSVTTHRYLCTKPSTNRQLAAAKKKKVLCRLFPLIFVRNYDIIPPVRQQANETASRHRFSGLPQAFRAAAQDWLIPNS